MLLLLIFAAIPASGVMCVQPWTCSERSGEPPTTATVNDNQFGFVDGPNLYAYVKQNPWSHFDPLGLAEDDLLPQNLTWGHLWSSPIASGQGEHADPANLKFSSRDSFSPTAQALGGIAEVSQFAVNGPQLTEGLATKCAVAGTAILAVKETPWKRVGRLISSLFSRSKPALETASSAKATLAQAEEQVARVGQWMSKGEYEAFKESGIIPRTNVLTKGKEGYQKQANVGDHYVEFDVDKSLLKEKDVDKGWSLVKSKNEMFKKLAEKKGEKLPEPIGKNIEHLDTKK